MAKPGLLRSFRKLIHDRCPIFFLATADHAIGNIAEDIYYGLLHARSSGKKIIILRRYSLFGRFKLGNTAIFGLQSPQSPGGFAALIQLLGNLALTVLFTDFSATLRYFGINTARVLRYLLDSARYRAFGRKGPKPRYIYRYQKHLYHMPPIGTGWLWNPGGHEVFSWPRANEIDWKKMAAEPMPLELPPAQAASARANFSRLGMPADAWYVCLHIRDAGFYGDAGNPRNTDIMNCLPAIEAITARGGWVVRLGDKSMRPLPELRGVIDYPFTEFKSAAMDLFLIQNCRLYIGTCSGMLDVAHLFQKPCVILNAIDWAMIFGIHAPSLAVLQHVYSRREGRFLSTAELLVEPHFCLGLERWDSNYGFLQNSPAEIREVVLEALERNAHPEYSPLQSDFLRLRIDQIRRWIDQRGSPGGYELNASGQYRYASRVVAARGTLGHAFLERHWQANKTPVPPQFAKPT